MIDLEEKYINYIKQIISKYLTNFEVYLYGSRAKGTARKYSDVDIAIFSEELSEKIRLKICFEFENSTFPFKLDIINMKTISKEFKELISDSLVKL